MKKLAVVVGHNSASPGAVRKDTQESEYTFNTRVARHMVEYARHTYPGLEVKTFFRQAGMGYENEIRDVYDRTDRWGADLTTELHFNSFGSSSAEGAEVLTSGTASSFKFAQNTQNILVARFGQKDRGVRTRASGRGAESLISGRAPAILVEPFFGSNPKGAAKFDSPEEERALAEAYVDAAAETLDQIPRTNLEDSRTIKDAETAKKLNSAAKTTVGVGGAVVTAVPPLDPGTVGEALSIGERAQQLAPWLGGGAILVGFILLFAIPYYLDRIQKHRKEDNDKELR